MGLTCAIMQPTYLPWAGYLALMASVDHFVLLDDVQYERKSWQCKNRILVDGAVKTLEVPVTKQPLTEKIENIVIDDAKPWRQAHLRELSSAYSHAPYGTAAIDLVSMSLERGLEKLAEQNTDLLRALARVLGIATPLVLASELRCGGRRSEHVAEICRAVGADSYLSPPGAREYLEQDRFAETSGISLHYFQFDPAPYPQFGADEFASHLSIIDVIANGGFEFAKRYVSRTS